MVFGPIQGGIEDYLENTNLQQGTWMALHEISHSLLEGISAVVAIGSLTQEDAEKIYTVAQCINAY